MVKIGNRRLFETKSEEWQKYTRAYQFDYGYIGYTIYKEIGKWAIIGFIPLLFASIMFQILLLFESQDIIFETVTLINQLIGIVGGAIFGFALMSFLGLAFIDILYLLPKVRKAAKQAGINEFSDEND